jgi:hypothetical protein
VEVAYESLKRSLLEGVHLLVGLENFCGADLSL